MLELAGERGVELQFFQSNHKGAIVDYLHGLKGRAGGLIINPGTLAHYSYSLRDAISALDIPTVEVHISNIFARESFRHHSYLSDIAVGVICGLGAQGYELALEAALTRIRSA